MLLHTWRLTTVKTKQKKPSILEFSKKLKIAICVVIYCDALIPQNSVIPKWKKFDNPETE